MTVNAAEGRKRPRRTALGHDKGTLGGKRPRSSMSPTIIAPSVCAEGVSGCNVAPFTLLAIGAPGGSDIIGGVANVLRNVLHSGAATVKELQHLTDLPRAIAKNEPHMGNAVVELALWN